MKKSILFLAFLLASCSNIVTLGDDYYYLSSDDAIDIGYPYGSMIYKSKYKNTFEETVIYADILRENFNSQYIIIEQQPNKRLVIRKIRQNLKFWNEYYLENHKDSLVEIGYEKITLKDIQNLIKTNELIRLDIITDSLFQHKASYKKIFKNINNYYIIQKKSDSIFGPLTLKNFEEIKRKKNIDLDFD